MKDSQVCPKCDGRDLVGNIPVGGMGGHPVVHAGWMNFTVVDIRVWICLNCGFAEHYARHTGQIRRQVDRRLANTTRVTRDMPVRVTPKDAAATG